MMYNDSLCLKLSKRSIHSKKKRINYSYDYYDYNGYDDVSQFFNSSYMNAKNSRIKDAKSKDANIKEKVKIGMMLMIEVSRIRRRWSRYCIRC